MTRDQQERQEMVERLLVEAGGLLGEVCRAQLGHAYMPWRSRVADWLRRCDTLGEAPAPALPSEPEKQGAPTARGTFGPAAYPGDVCFACGTAAPAAGGPSVTTAEYPAQCESVAYKNAAARDAIDAPRPSEPSPGVGEPLPVLPEWARSFVDSAMQVVRNRVEAPDLERAADIEALCDAADLLPHGWVYSDAPSVASLVPELRQAIGKWGASMYGDGIGGGFEPEATVEQWTWGEETTKRWARVESLLARLEAGKGE